MTNAKDRLIIGLDVPEDFRDKGIEIVAPEMPTVSEAGKTFTKHLFIKFPVHLTRQKGFLEKALPLLVSWKSKKQKIRSEKMWEVFLVGPSQ